MRSGCGQALEALEIIANGHGQGEELFQGLARGLEADGDLAGRKIDSAGQVVELEAGDGGRRLDVDLRLPEPILAPQLEAFGEAEAALVFVVGGLAAGELAEAVDEPLAVGDGVGADLVGTAQAEDLLGPAPADAQEIFQGGPVDPWVGQGIEFGDDGVEVTEPGRFIGHAG